jgi:hypothetical protein
MYLMLEGGYETERSRGIGPLGGFTNQRVSLSFFLDTTYFEK